MQIRLPRLRLPWGRASKLRAETSRAVVAQRDVDQAYLSQNFPGWTVLHPGDPVFGMYDEIVVLMMGGTPATEAERRAETEWLQDLRLCIKLGGEIKMMAPRA